MKTAYITVQAPYGKEEQFILPEIIEFMNSGNEVLVLPLRPDKKLCEGEEQEIISPHTLAIPIHSKGVIILGTALFFKRPFKSIALVAKLLNTSGNPIKALKNLSVLGKGLTLSEVITRRGGEHIHANWGGSTATAAYIASYVSGISWSFTCHSRDITENNMLREKVKSAKFVRVINDNGYNEVINLVGEDAGKKCIKLHIGININPDEVKLRVVNDIFTIAVPADMVEAKGHEYLIEAINIIVKQGFKMLCNLYGDGNLKDIIMKKVIELELSDYITFNEELPDDKRFSMFGRGEVDAVILPSIVTLNEKEEIPVALMEAMAYKIPVISTNTGGIPELLRDEAGILVEEKNSAQLAQAIIRLMEDKVYYEKIALKGYNRVYEDFYLKNIIIKLVELMK